MRPCRNESGSVSDSRTSRSSWNCTSRYRGIDTADRHSTKTPYWLTSRLTTDAKRVVPRWSFQVRRAARATGRLSATRLSAGTDLIDTVDRVDGQVCVTISPNRKAADAGDGIKVQAATHQA